MDEVEKIKYTKAFIDSLAEGINPLNGEPIPEGDLLNNVRISRCMFYVSTLLDKLCSGKGLTAPKKKLKNADKQPFSITDDCIRNFEYVNADVYASDIANKLNALIDADAIQKIKVSAITEWLTNEGYLQLHDSANGKAYKKPTDAGKELGISEEFRSGNLGGYFVLRYNINAQKYIVEHANAIGKMSYKKTENQGSPWTDEQDAKLKELFNDGLVVAEIAEELGRTPASTRSRMVTLGLINDRHDIV